LICRNLRPRQIDNNATGKSQEKLTMWPTKSDFRIQASNFDPTNGLNILRIICGLFMFPHVLGKFAGGFQPPELWVCIAAVAESAAGIALVLGICTRFAALGACFLLAVAVYSLQVVKGFGWTWNTGGYEYPVFWAITSLCVAIEAWKGHFVPVQRPAHGSHFVSRAPLVH
jgi:putative oxidoreductase